MAEIIWSENAMKDIEEIAEFIAQDSEYYALLIVEKIYHSAQRLIGFPKSGRKIPEIDRDKYREIIADNYRVMYKLKSDIVEILTVLHARRDTSSLDEEML